jgi:hypothetical protein
VAQELNKVDQSGGGGSVGGVTGGSTGGVIGGVTGGSTGGVVTGGAAVSDEPPQALTSAAIAAQDKTVNNLISEL